MRRRGRRRRCARPDSTATGCRWFSTWGQNRLSSRSANWRKSWACGWKSCCRKPVGTSRMPRGTESDWAKAAPSRNTLRSSPPGSRAWRRIPNRRSPVSHFCQEPSVVRHQPLNGHPTGEASPNGRATLATLAPPASAEYRGSETAFSQFFWASPTPMAISGFDGRIQRVNPAWEPILRCSSEEVEGTLLFDWVHPEDSATAAAEFERLLISGKRIAFECRCQGKDGPYRWLLLNGCALQDARAI